MKPVTEIREAARPRPFAMLALLSGLILAFIGSAVAPQLAAAGPTEYPVRICSPNYPAQPSLHNGMVGNPEVFFKAANGTVTYGKVGNVSGGWNAYDPAIRCATANSGDAPSVGNFGIRFFNSANGLFNKNEEGGLEWTIPGDLKLRQVGLSGKSLYGEPANPNNSQGGIGGGGTFLKFDFIGGETKTGKPSTNYGKLDGFSATNVQNASKYRLGLICSPTTAATVCMGGTGEQVVVNDIQFVMTDPQPPSLSIEPSSIASEQWVKGDQTVTFTAQDTGSGLRETAVFIDTNQVSERTVPGCSLVAGTFANSSDNLLQARSFRPCPTTPQTETVSIDTTKFGDGIHELRVCARDYAGASKMWNGDQKAAWTCSQSKDVKIDNTVPGAPETAEAINTRIPRSVNPNDVTWTNPGVADSGSPIHEVHYSIVNQAGKEVVSSTNVDNGSTSTLPANAVNADNIVHIPTLATPLGSGEFTLRVQLEDSVGQVGKVAEVPLSYSCENSGGTPLPQADIAMGLTEAQQATELASDFLGLDQGEKSTVVGKVRGPGQMPINGADLCINAKPVVDPQLQLLSETTTNGNGNFSSPLTPGPSRNLLTVFRQGHRETWSDPVRTEVTVYPTLSTGLEGNYSNRRKKITVRSGQRVWFKGIIPGPYPDKVLVVMQGKAKGAGANSNPKTWRAFRRYRTRFGGKFKMPNRFYNNSKTRKAHILVRSQVRNQVGYPYSEGDSQIMEVVVLPKKKKSSK